MTARRNLAVVIPESGPRHQWGALLDDFVRKTAGLTVYDDYADPARSIDLAKQLSDDTSLYAVIGHFSSAAARAAIPLYAARGIRAVFPLSSADDVVSQHLKNALGVIAPMPSDSEQARAVAAYCAGRRASAIALAPGTGLAREWIKLGQTLAQSPSDADDVEVLFVIGRLDEVAKAWPRLKAWQASGIEVVLSDDSWAGARDFVTRTPRGARLYFVRSEPGPSRLLHAAVSHAVAMRDLRSSVQDFSALWTYDAVHWVLEPMEASTVGA